MVHTAADTPPRATGRAATSLRTLQVVAVLAVVNLAWQFVTAGQLLPRGGSVGPHAAGAIALHVLTALVVLAAGWHYAATREAWWPTLLAAVVFVLTFVQAYVGSYATLAVHVPGAVVLTVGSVWIAAWSFSQPRAR